MNNKTPTEYFRIVKAHVEQHLDRTAWQWSRTDSQLLDWAIHNMETIQ